MARSSDEDGRRLNLGIAIAITLGIKYSSTVTIGIHRITCLMEGSLNFLQGEEAVKFALVSKDFPLTLFLTRFPENHDSSNSVYTKQIALNRNLEAIT